VREDRECCATGESRCWREYGVASCFASSGGDGLGDGAVLGDQVVGIDAQMRLCRGIRQVEDVKVDRYTTYAAAHFERVDSTRDEVAKELRPGALLAVGCIPDARLAGLVVAPGPRAGSAQEVSGCRVGP
jgi:hypothetical protein